MPAVAGQFYPSQKQELEKMISGFMEKSAEKTRYLGAVSPHAGYIYSGKVAAKVLSRVKCRDSFIILGPNHTGMGKPLSMMAAGTWHMPMGDIEIDKDLAKVILKNSKLIENDASAHTHEHSIEVQLPFLQHEKAAFKFVPIVISLCDISMLKQAGKDLALAIRASKKEVAIIASSDMTHYESQESAKEKDKRAIDAIIKMDEDNLMNEVRKHDISMCGVAPTIVMLSALKELGAVKTELVDYRTSGDTSGDYSSVVGYAGILIN